MSHYFRLLGPIEVTHKEERIHVGGPKQQMFLMALLFNMNRPVSLDWLTEALWDGEPPPSATANLRNYAGRLRSILSVLEGTRVMARYQAYQLVTTPEHVDLTRFERLVADGRAQLSKGRCVDGVRRLDEAVSLWRYPLKYHMNCGKRLAARVMIVQEQRLNVMEERAWARLALGDHGRAISELRLLLGEEPLREHAWALLMRALYAAGDAAGALRAYAEARSCLLDRIGLDPGPELRRIHEAVLRRDLDVSVSPPPSLQRRERGEADHVWSGFHRDDALATG